MFYYTCEQVGKNAAAVELQWWASVVASSAATFVAAFVDKFSNIGEAFAWGKHEQLFNT